MGTTQVKQPGQIAFEAYNENRGGKTHDGKPTPSWENLTPGVREGWQVAALAARADVLRECIAALGGAIRIKHKLDTAALEAMPHHELMAAFMALTNEAEATALDALET